ncbi:MAG: transporter substrate-binding domain-containing protein [Verrucomicrobia bacterium]|nr:transporter substrate-binding domain-containing protein [Verrucomicrobiota bacterium]
MILQLLASFFLITSIFAEPLRVGMELSYPPFETIDAKGNPSGVSVDLAEALGRALGREVEIKNIPFVGLIPALSSRRIDLILSSLSKTAEREKAIRFSDPYLTTGLCLLINRKVAVNTIEELDKKNYTLVVKLGTTGETYARMHIKRATVRSLDQEATCVLEVVQGRASAFIYDQFSVLALSQKYPESTKANLVPFVKESWAIGMRLEDEALQNQVNHFLKAFRAEGGFDKLADKYLKEQKALFAKEGIPFVFQ